MLISQKIIQSSVEVLERGHRLTPAILYDLAMLVDTVCMSEEIVTLPAGCGVEIDSSRLASYLRTEGIALSEKPKATAEDLRDNIVRLLNSLQIPSPDLTERLTNTLFEQVDKFVEFPLPRSDAEESIAYPVKLLDDLLKGDVDRQTAIYMARSFLYWIEATETRRTALVLDFGRVPFLNSFLSVHSEILVSRIREEVLGLFEAERRKVLKLAMSHGKQVYPLPLLLSTVLVQCRGDKKAFADELLFLRRMLSKDRERLRSMESEMSEARSQQALAKTLKRVENLKSAIANKFGRSGTALLVTKFGLSIADGVLDGSYGSILRIPVDGFITWLNARPAARLLSLLRAESLVSHDTLRKLFGELPSDMDFQQGYSLYRFEE